MKLLDLTHTLTSDIPSWDGGTVFELTIESDYKDCVSPNLFRNHAIRTKAGAGTHIDAPAHCFPGGKTIDALDIEDLAVNCVVIHINQADENYLATPDVIEKFEKEHGLIPPKTFVIFHTGWSAPWGDRKKYRNNLAFPSIHEDTAKLLLRRGVVGMGIDTLSVDAGGIDFPAHRAMLGAEKYIVENITNLKDMPATGARVFIFPIKIAHGSESPVRVIAEIP